jgi:ABC-type uncharacterized transport system involved in gliding motility auxiliary subunit
MEDEMKKYMGAGALFGLVLIAAGLIHYQTGKIWNWFSWATTGLGVLLIIAFCVFRFDKIKETVSLRSFRYGGNALAVSLMVFVILGLVNFTANKHSVRVDLSKGGQFSLAQQTKSVLKTLKKDVRVIAFYKSETQKPMEDLLKSYRFYSSKFRYEFVDPDKKPATAKLYGVTAYEILVFECGTQTEKINEKDEQAVTNALIKVTREGKKAIYFLDGHGENDIDSNDKTGYGTAKKAVSEENYDVKKLNLAIEKRIPKDCAVLVVGGAQKALFQPELDSIQAYLDRGGKALFLLDPEPSYGFTAFLEKWGIKVGNDVVLDVSGMGQLFGMGPWVPLVQSYEPHRITEKFRVMTFFPYCRSVTPETTPGGGITVQKLLKTTQSSWAETDVKNPRAQFNEGKDLAGPVSIAAVSGKETGGNKSRLVIFGDSDFANNSYFKVQGNGDLFMNTVNWLAEEEDLISIRAKQPEDRRVFLTAKQASMVMYTTVIFMPLAALLAGIGIYIKRERRSK